MEKLKNLLIECERFLAGISSESPVAESLVKDLRDAIPEIAKLQEACEAARKSLKHLQQPNYSVDVNGYDWIESEGDKALTMLDSILEKP